MIEYGTLATYSEQQLIDCAGGFENYGCDGGLPSHAFEYIDWEGGITSERDYPYTAEDGDCTASEDQIFLNVFDGAHNVTAGDEQELKDAVFTTGPVSIAFQVVDGFSAYTSGVYSSDTCGKTEADVNHAVLAVGYGVDVETGMAFWYVKNSWGATWGDEGFFKIERNVNMCAIAMCNSYPERIWEHRCMTEEEAEEFTK